MPTIHPRASRATALLAAAVSHDLYRPRLDRGRDVFQLHPNGWHFAAGHVPKLEVHEPPDGEAIATPSAHVLPEPEARGGAARACRLAGGGAGACPTVGTVRGARG